MTIPVPPRWPNPGPDGRLKEKHLPAHLAQTNLNATYGRIEDVATKAEVAPTAEAALAASDVNPHPELFPYYAKLANAASAPVNVMLLGDSLWEGVGGNTADGRMWVQLQKILNQRYSGGLAVPKVFVPARNSPSVPVASDETWTVTGTMYNQGYGPRGSARQLTAGSSCSMTFRASSFDLYFKCIYGASTVTVTIDGGAPTTVNLVNGNNMWSSGPLTLGNHTVVIAFGSGSPYFAGTKINTDVVNGVRMWNFSVAGFGAKHRSGVADAAAADFSTWIGQACTPDLVVVPLLGNDTPEDTAATYKTNMTTVVSSIRAKTAAPILLIPNWGPNVRSHVDPWANYMQALREVAASSTNVAFHNLNRAVQNRTDDPAGIANGLPHLNDKGQLFHAMLVADVLSLPR